MKNILLVLCVLCTSAAFGQYGVGSRSSEPLVYQSPSHPAHAGYAPMLQEQSVLASSSYTSAQGERRPSDFPQADGVSLGAYARELKQQRAQSKKSRVVWINQ